MTMAWWDNQCKGKKKDGSQCHNDMMRAYEIEDGNLFVPLTCHLHESQDEEIKKELDVNLVD